MLAADHLAKAVMLSTLPPGRARAVTEFFSLQLACNTGAAFSFMRDAGAWPRYVFSAVAIAAAVLIVWLLRRGGERLYCAGLALILGGALGNLWDRVSVGCVVDFLSFHWQRWYYPAFNVADSAITIGAVLLIWHAMRRGRDPAAPA